MSFIAELKRRNVFRVGVAYAVVAWVAMQVVDIVLPTFDAPRWVNQTLLFLIILGFPVALLLAWAFELTPEGIKLTKEVAPEQSIRAHTGHRMNAVIVGGLALVLLLVVLDAYVLTDNATTEVAAGVATQAAAEPGAGQAEAAALDAAAQVDQNSVAVLPFANLSDDANQEYFSDGLTEELINKLSQVEGLLVTGRNSSFYFKDKDDALPDIGRQLGVRHVLQGSVRKAGDELRITAQLLDVETNANLWSDSFDRNLTDIFAVQDEIAEAVATALSITLRAGVFSDPAMTGNIDAYEAFMQAEKLRYDVEAGRASLLDVIAQLERAVALDPDFAIVWIRLRDLYTRSNTGLRPSETQDFAQKAQRALERAVALAPQHRALLTLNALAHIDQNRYAEAEGEIQAMLLDIPSDPAASRLYSRFLWVTGRSAEALRYSQQAKRLDPFSAETSFMLSAHLLNQGRMDEARAEVARAREQSSAEDFLSGMLILADLQEGDLAAARAGLMARANSELTDTLLSIWDEQGDAAAVRELQRIGTSDDISFNGLVVYREIAAALGDAELGLELLNKTAVAPGDIWLPFYGDVRKLPGFKDFARERGLLDYWRSTGNWSDYCRPVNDDFECF